MPPLNLSKHEFCLSVLRVLTHMARLVAEAGRSASPYVASEAGNISDDGKPSPAKGKSKSKAKKAGEGRQHIV